MMPNKKPGAPPRQATTIHMDKDLLRALRLKAATLFLHGRALLYSIDDAFLMTVVAMLPAAP